jgi:hypothetical protein
MAGKMQLEPLPESFVAILDDEKEEALAALVRSKVKDLNGVLCYLAKKRGIEIKLGVHQCVSNTMTMGKVVDTVQIRKMMRVLE